MLYSKLGSHFKFVVASTELPPVQDNPGTPGSEPSANGHGPRNSITFSQREVNILSAVAGNSLSKETIICHTWETPYIKDGPRQFAGTIQALNQKLTRAGTPLQIKNTGERGSALYELVDTSPKDDPLPGISIIPHDDSRLKAFEALAGYDEEARLARQNQRPSRSTRNQELRAQIESRNPVLPSDGSVIELTRPFS